MRKGLFGHRAAVNVVDFDEKHIVSASGDRTIKVWTATTCEFVRTLSGHRRGIGKQLFFFLYDRNYRGVLNFPTLGRSKNRWKIKQIVGKFSICWKIKHISSENSPT